jgi:hypothetical protein
MRRPIRHHRGDRLDSEADRPARIDHVSDLLDTALRDLGVRHQVRELQLQELFAEIVGPALAPLCEAVKLDRGALVVATRNGALAHQLQLEMPKLVAALNRRLGADMVKRLRFVPME